MMKTTLQKLFFILLASQLCMSMAHASQAISLSSPPDSLARWYKPENKRQVWLHTMFRLRREMLAIEEYAETNPELTANWIGKLEKDYMRIADMVPEWSAKINPALVRSLKQQTPDGQASQIKKTLRKIRKTCNNCHDEYQPLVAALYRSPDYNGITVPLEDGSSQSFAKAMRELPDTINRIQIAMEDGFNHTAKNASQQLSSQLKRLARSCRQCHDEQAPIDRILGLETNNRLKELNIRIDNNNQKKTAKLLGELGVTVCARCHSTHRTLGDLRNQLEDLIPSN